MNTLMDLFFGERDTVIIKYFSKPYPEKEDVSNHINIFSLSEIQRITLNESSFTIVWNAGGFTKYFVRQDFDVQKISDLAENRFGKGLKVIEHFANLKLKQKLKD